MNNAELIDAVAVITGATKANTKTAVDAVFAVLSNELAAGNEIAVNGFGKFQVTERPAREGRNPQTGEALQIAASKSAKLKASKTLKDRLV